MSFRGDRMRDRGQLRSPRAPDASQRPLRCDAEPGPSLLACSLAPAASWVPALRRATSCRVTSGTRGNLAPSG